MKIRRVIWLCCLAGLVAVVVAAFLMYSSNRESVKETSPPPRPTASVEKAAPVVADQRPEHWNQAEAALAAVPRRENVVPESGDARAKVVKVRPGQVLATVNGVTITLKDLVPLPGEKAGTEQALSAEMYEFLLNRAVDRELTFQVAGAQGVKLTSEQEQQLAQVRASSEQRDPAVFDTVQQNPANAEFELRDFTALMLRASLAAKAGVGSQYATPGQVQEFYEKHQTEYGSLPADPAERRVAWQRIDMEIRQKIAPQLQAEYQEKLGKYVEQLRSSAKITTLKSARD